MFEPGTQIGRYEIQRRLGRGGMGTVYAAHDPVLGRLVAIKVFAGDLDIPDARERFTREARSAAALTHPHIVAIYDFGEYDSQPYIVMEYVPGETLAEVIRRKAPVSLADKLRWVEELTGAAGYAHQMSVIHRDIKPANLIIDRSGRLKILDFGIARMLAIASNTKDMIGTPGYMAPEQIVGGTVDRRADLFSIGVVFYELLSYTEAFPGDTLPTITHRILNEEPVPLPSLVPNLHRSVTPIIERALKKNVEERFPDAETLRKAVNRVRRRLEEDTAGTVVAHTVLRPETPSPNRSRTGTGSSKRPAPGVVGVVTPPPADREALARRRTAQLEAALDQARTLLATGDLELALDACQQALTLDEHHPGALELEGKIRLAFAERQAETEEEEDDVEADEGVVEETIPAPAVAGVEYAPTVLAPPRRTPAPQPQVSAPAAVPVEPTTLKSTPPRRLKTTPPRPLKTTPPRPRKTPVPRKPAAPSLLARMRAGAPAVKARLGALVPGPRLFAPVGLAFTRAVARLKRPPAPAQAAAVSRPVASGRNAKIAWVGGAVVVVVLVVAIAAAVMLMPRPAAITPTGILVIDAVPWGTITEIQAEDGERRQLPSPASTPLSLGLPVGTYQVLVAGPTPDAEAQRITVRVDADKATMAPMVRFNVISPEEYFEQYLAAPSTPAETAPPSSESTAPPPTAPVTPAGVSQ